MNDIERRFKYHKPDEERRAQHDAWREEFIAWARSIAAIGSSREVSLALTKLEECSFWVHADIARRQYDDEQATLVGQEPS